MKIFHIQDGLHELPALPAQAPPQGYLWVSCTRREFEVQITQIQAGLQTWTGGQLVDLHVSDLLNNQLPSHFDYTSWYDLMVFRRLAAGVGSDGMFMDEERGTASTALQALKAIDTSPIGFAVFDHVLLTVHPADCLVRDFFVGRLLQMASTESANGSAARLPSSPADLMLRMINHVVDSYLDLRRRLTRQFSSLQQALLSGRGRAINWQALLESRISLHMLEEVCEDQRSAVQEWIDAMDEWPAEAGPAAARDRELLRVRSRDVLEHIERVLSHVRRLENSAESAVQMHFSALGQRTNDIMRTLTVLTAIFLPLNLITGIFGMNFDSLPLIHTARGFWIALFVMLGIAASLVWFFWRKRYVGSNG